MYKHELSRNMQFELFVMSNEKEHLHCDRPFRNVMKQNVVLIV